MIPSCFWWPAVWPPCVLRIVVFGEQFNDFIMLVGM